ATGTLVEGTVSAHRTGYGFVRAEGLEVSVFLPPPEMAGIMHGDRVRVAVQRAADGRYSGRVEQVLARGISGFLGTVEIANRSTFVTSADRRLALRCHVAAADLHDARSGDWVIARITRYPEGAGAGAARIEKRLDPERPVELATEAAVARFELPHEFDDAALREAHACGQQVDPAEAARRLDLRALPLVTIDGADAKDFDDAVYAERSGEGFRLIVAIADVSHYVRPGSALDTAARERGTSVYFPSRVIPMLPTALSNHLCSLEPRVDRLCFAADMTISSAGALLGATFHPAVMRSAARLTYSQANAAVFEGQPQVRTELGALLNPLLVLMDLYRVLQKARNRRGALDFDTAEVAFDIDERERVRGINLYARNDAHRLVEECMIMANVAVARHIAQSKMAALYRVHGAPEQKKLGTLRSTLAAIGIEMELPEVPAPRDLQRITQRLGHALERPFLESVIVRSMQQALYQPENIGHFGLALSHYAHFTSPIRRYPDLVVHRALKALGDPRDLSGARTARSQLELLGADLSRLEKRADEADRFVAAFLKCVWLRDRIGQTFEGLITTVVEFGCFVQILAIAADGLLHTATLRDDEYVMEDDGHAWVGRRTRRRLRIGTRVQVIVTAVNPIEGLIDLDVAAPVAEAQR
ncbi:MAG: ribonuclease R, partial [Steroidobacteraceae bacterium]